MPSLIKSICTNCTLCESVCPTSSIRKGISKYVIDRDTCFDCKECVPVCPVQAIVEVDEEK
ncbi:MAG: 4Fe-4S binding protein [Oligoflexia bacterium]|nr:4Fe-4S binding protein [Oligoflexia bacterium]